jgi:putative ABC transport system permease protein
MPIAPGHAFRRWLVFISALAVAGLATVGWLAAWRAEESLRRASARLGADIVVLPAGAQASVEAALVTGGRPGVWMPEDNVQRIASLPGVAAVSPQLYLSVQPQASTSLPDALLVIYDPATDFSLRPWLDRYLPQGLGPHSAIGGSGLPLPVGDGLLWLYGCPLQLAGNLEPTGTRLDRSLYLTFEAAHEIARRSYGQAAQPFQLPGHGISVALVRARPGVDPHTLAQDIARAVPGTTALASADLFAAPRTRARRLRHGVLAALPAVLLLHVYAAHRARGMGVWAGALRPPKPPKSYR